MSILLVRSKLLHHNYISIKFFLNVLIKKERKLWFESAAGYVMETL